MKFLANENIPLKSIYYLRNAGFDISSISEEFPGISDREVLQKSQFENRIILTFDRDYGELIFRFKMGLPAGIVYFRLIPNYPTEPAEYLIRMLSIENLKLENYFTIVDAEKIRQRLI